MGFRGPPGVPARAEGDETRSGFARTGRMPDGLSLLKGPRFFFQIARFELADAIEGVLGRFGFAESR